VARRLLIPMTHHEAKDPDMSNLLTPVDLQALEAVTGGKSAARCTSSNDPMLQNMMQLSNTLTSMGKASNATGFSTTEIMMLGLLLSQQRSARTVNVLVRRPCW
jgi:hypothetical protein